MSIIGSNILAGAAGASGASTGYQIERSLRFNQDDAASLSKTFSSAGNRRTWGWSSWVKLCSVSYQNLFANLTGNTDGLYVFWDTNGKFYITDYNLSGGASLTSARYYRDHSAWYHIVIAFDTTQATAANRVKLYINGVQETLTGQQPNQNIEGQWNQGSRLHYIGRQTNSITNYTLDAYLADVHFIDGQALAPTDFGEFDDNNVWQPKEFSGTYGTNGFHLDFSDNSSSAALGYDAAGSNNWTVNNISVASGAGNDSLVDTPTNYGTDTGAGGEVRGNYCTLNPLQNIAGDTFSDGNLKVATSTSSYATYTSSMAIPKSGKWYAELTVVSLGTYFMVGLCETNSQHTTSKMLYQHNGVAYYSSDGSRWIDGSSATYGATFAANDVIGIAVDADNNTVTFYKNGSSQGVISNVPSREYYFAGGDLSASASGTQIWNFGARPFTHAAPSGYKALCTTNLPEPTIADGSAYMDVALWTGQGNTNDRTITTSFNPEFVWIKSRSDGTYNHALFDANRGYGTNNVLSSNTTGAEGATDQGYIKSSTDSSITLGVSGGGNAYYNGNNFTYAAWYWDAGANSSKTYAVTVVSDSGNKYRFDGFGTSAVTLELEEGSTYTFDQSDSSNAGHPLRFSTTSNGTHGGGSEYTTGVVTNGTPGSTGSYTKITVAASAPTLYYYCTQHSGMGGQANTNSTAGASNFDGSIQSTVRANPAAGFSVVKYTGNGSQSTVAHGLNAAPLLVITKATSGTSRWAVHMPTIIGGNYYLELNGSSAKQSWGSQTLNDPTSTTFDTVYAVGVNENNVNYVAYCFAPVEGYSRISSWTGNGSADGPFVYTGMRPKWILWKSSSNGGEHWHILDAERDPHNLTSETLYANLTNAESTFDAAGIDILSNGFKVRGTNAGVNGNNYTYIFLALAENPFRTARAR